MKAKMLTVLTVSALLLTACGSDNKKPQVNNQTNPSNNPPAANNNTPADPAAANNNTPADPSIPVQEWTFTTMNAQNDGTQFSKIKIGDREMDIVPQANDTRLGQIDDGGTLYARYGMILDEQQKKAVVFYQGEPTPINDMNELSTYNDTLTYQGQSFAMLPDKTTGSVAEWQGKSTFQVNFAQKTLTGELTDWKANKSNNKLDNITFNATISGNTFANKDANLKVEGKFYGAYASNLAGAFQNVNKNVYGAFGADRVTPINSTTPGGTGGGQNGGGHGGMGDSNTGGFGGGEYQ